MSESNFSEVNPSGEGSSEDMTVTGDIARESRTKVKESLKV